MKTWLRRFLLSVSLPLVLLPLACGAQPAAAYQEGKQYSKVQQSVSPVDPKKVTVQEFFWYGCPHCFHADPIVEAWKAKKALDVDFERIPNTLGRPEGELHARAFYIAETLGVLDKTHAPLFNAIHEKHLPMNTLASIRELYGNVAGVKPADFDNATSSFVVDSRLRRADQLAKTYLITSVPTFVVGGKYITSAVVAGSVEQTMSVVDFLVDKIRKERK